MPDSDHTNVEHIRFTNTKVKIIQVQDLNKNRTKAASKIPNKTSGLLDDVYTAVSTAIKYP